MTDADVHFEKAMERARDGDLDTAAELFRQASDRGHAMGAYALAALLKDGGRLAEAEPHYRRALASGLPATPPHLVADCEMGLGFVRAQLGDDAEAEVLYRSADARGHLDATFNLGNLLDRTGRAAEAEHVWRRAAAAGSADAAYNLAGRVGERGDLAEAERLLRQAMAAGLTDAIANLARVRLQRDDPHEAEALLRRAVAAGDHDAVFSLGLVLNVLGRLDEAEATLRRAGAAGHPEAGAHVNRLVAARTAKAVAPPNGRSAAPVDSAAVAGLFARDASRAERIRAIQTLCRFVGARLSAGRRVATQGADVLVERGTRLLSELAARLPIRTDAALCGQFGDDPEARSQHVVAEADRLADLLWTTAAVVPGPPALVRTIKMVIHSAIEIRMVGELYSIHSGRAERDQAWLDTILLAWASDRPVAHGGSVAVTTAAIATKVRSIAEMTSGHRREGAAAMRRAGERMHRRMRPHPSSWARPDHSAGATLAHEASVQVAERVADRIGGLAPQALLAAGRRLAPSATVAIEDPPAPMLPADPHEALAQASVLHQRATAAVAAPSTSDPVAARLRMAVAAQERHLADLRRRLGHAPVSVPAAPRGPQPEDAGRLWQQVEDAIDAVEEAGARSRRLPSWSTLGRATFGYLIIALAVSVLPTVAILGSSGASLVGLLLVQCLALPWLSLAAGALAAGTLFRPWLGGSVPRHPLTGAVVVLGTHIGLGAIAAVLGLLL